MKVNVYSYIQVKYKNILLVGLEIHSQDSRSQLPHNLHTLNHMEKPVRENFPLVPVTDQKVNHKSKKIDM